MECFELGATVKATVIQITPYGAFLECGNGQKGLLHISEISYKFIADIHEVIELNQLLDVKIIAIDPTNQYLRFSLKQLPQSDKTKSGHHVRIKLPTHEINFTPLAEALPKWIEDALKETEE